MSICMYVCIYVCMHVCIYVCIYVCVCVSVCVQQSLCVKYVGRLKSTFRYLFMCFYRTKVFPYDISIYIFIISYGSTCPIKAHKQISECTLPL